MGVVCRWMWCVFIQYLYTYKDFKNLNCKAYGWYTELHFYSKPVVSFNISFQVSLRADFWSVILLHQIHLHQKYKTDDLLFLKLFPFKKKLFLKSKQLLKRIYTKLFQKTVWCTSSDIVLECAKQEIFPLWAWIKKLHFNWQLMFLSWLIREIMF